MILWTIAHHAPLSMGFTRQEYWSGFPCPPPGDLSNLENEPTSHVSCSGRQVLYYWVRLGKPLISRSLSNQILAHVSQLLMLLLPYLPLAIFKVLAYIFLVSLIQGWNKRI